VADADRFQLIVTVVPQGSASRIVEAAKSAGARGGTILRGRGTGVHESGRFLGIPIEPEKELILVLVERLLTTAILEAIVVTGKLAEPGQGIAFVLDVPRVEGVAQLAEASGLARS
jgi:nitrogen regulatory protein P-II 1